MCRFGVRQEVVDVGHPARRSSCRSGSSPGRRPHPRRRRRRPRRTRTAPAPGRGSAAGTPGGSWLRAHPGRRSASRSPCEFRTSPSESPVSLHRAGEGLTYSRPVQTFLALVALLLAAAALGVAVGGRRTTRKRAAVDAGDLPDDPRALRQEVAALKVGEQPRHCATSPWCATTPSPTPAGQLSWSMALLDDSGSGVVVTAIQGRNESRTYAKNVASWSSETQLLARGGGRDLARASMTRRVIEHVPVRRLDSRHGTAHATRRQDRLDLVDAEAAAADHRDRQVRAEASRMGASPSSTSPACPT